MARARARGKERALAVAALVLPIVACTLVTPLDGLTGGGDGGVDSGAPFEPPETGTASDDGGVSPPMIDSGGGQDAAPVDSSPASEAEASTPDAGEAGIGYCAALAGEDSGLTKLLFCDDFDEGLLVTPWDQVTMTGATASLSAALAVSPPNAMLVQTDVDAGSVDCAGYRIFKSPPVAGVFTGTYTLAFDLNVVVADETTISDTVLSAIELFDKYGSRWALQLELSYNATSKALAVDLSENSSPGDGGPDIYTAHPAPTTTTLPLGTWTRVSMAIDVVNAVGPGATKNLGTLTLGGVPAVSADMHVATTDGLPEILVGATYARQSAGTWTALYDNVTLTYE